MKAMVLAAGLGTRMRPLSLLRAKPALPVLNRPLLHWTLAALRRAGVRDVVINTHHRPASIRAAAGDGSAHGLRVRYSHERRILGSIGGVRQVRELLGARPFLLVNGDSYFDFDLRLLGARMRETGACAAVSLQPHPAFGRYGSIVTDPRGRVRSFAGWPGPARGRAWHFTGVQVLEPRLLDRLPPGYAETARDLYGPLLAEGGRVVGVPHGGAWYDLSSPPLYLALQMHLLQARSAEGRADACIHQAARVHASARVRRAVVGAGCEVGPLARVEDSVLWERVEVGPGARVRRCVVTDRVRVAAGERLRGMLLMARRPRGADGSSGPGGRFEARLRG